ncbi:MAG TPA: hypothetical protein VF008_09800 [Niastella sp.]
MPAFPLTKETTDHVDEGYEIYTGLSKRELIAAMAMQGILSNDISTTPIRTIAGDAVAIADALLLELSKPQP